MQLLNISMCSLVNLGKRARSLIGGGVGLSGRATKKITFCGFPNIIPYQFLVQKSKAQEELNPDPQQGSMDWIISGHFKFSLPDIIWPDIRHPA